MELNIGLKLNAAILSKFWRQNILLQAFFRLLENLEVEQMMFGELFRVCFLSCIVEKLLLWLLVGYYFCLNCFTFFRKIKVKWPSP